MNDMSYSCIAHLLADSVVTAAEPGTESLRLHQGAKKYQQMMVGRRAVQPAINPNPTKSR